MLMSQAPDQIFTVADMAQELGLSRHHLAKILQQLARGGIVSTRRGGGGGAILAKPPGAIRIGAVVRLLEEDQALVECLAANGGQCSLDLRCRLKARLRAAERAFLDDLDRSTLADVVLPQVKAA